MRHRIDVRVDAVVYFSMRLFVLSVGASVCIPWDLISSVCVPTLGHSELSCRLIPANEQRSGEDSDSHRNMNDPVQHSSTLLKKVFPSSARLTTIVEKI